MGNGGYYILVWDDWGAGLVMINPRFLTDGEDHQGNPRNWFTLPIRPEPWTLDEIVDHAVERHKLPWLGEHPDPGYWKGSAAGSTEYKFWKVVV